MRHLQILSLIFLLISCNNHSANIEIEQNLDKSIVDKIDKLNSVPFYYQLSKEDIVLINQSVSLSDSLTDYYKGLKKNFNKQYCESFDSIAKLRTSFRFDNVSFKIQNNEVVRVKYLLQMILESFVDEIVNNTLLSNDYNAIVITDKEEFKIGETVKINIISQSYNSNFNPDIYVGDYDSTLTSDNIWQYRMVGKYDSIRVVDGIGEFRFRFANSKEYKIRGLIKMRNLKGDFINRPYCKIIKTK